MNLELIVSPEAEADIREAFAFYETIDDELAQRFVHHINTQLLKIRTHPRAFPVIYNQYHRLLLPDFPFAVFYSIENDHIRILAVFHQQRNIDKLIGDR